jgi:hypothetical protein
MKKVAIICLALLGLFTSVLYAQIDCEDIKMIIDAPSDPANLACADVTSYDDCFRISFPIFFEYDGSTMPPPSEFIVTELNLEGSVLGGLRTYVSSPFSNECADIEDFSFEISPDNKHFKLELDAAVEIPFGNSSTPFFWIIVEAIPGESVEVDITSLSFFLFGAGECTNTTIDVNGAPIEKDAPSTCTESNLEVVFGTPDPIDGKIHIPLLLNHSETNIDLYEFDIQFEVVDVFGNLEVVDFLPGSGIVHDLMGGAGEWTIYCIRDYDSPEAIGTNHLIGTLLITPPTATNIQAEVDITFEFARINFENSTAQYCCSPEIEPDNIEIQSGLLPCDDVSSRVQLSFISPDPTTCPEEMYFDVFVHLESAMDVSQLELDLFFDLSGGATITSIFIPPVLSCTGVLCPGESTCVDFNGNEVFIKRCSPSTGESFPSGATGIVRVFVDMPFGSCVGGIAFSRVVFEELNEAACAPVYTNFTDVICMGRIFGDIQTEDFDEIDADGLEFRILSPLLDLCDVVTTTGCIDSYDECFGYECRGETELFVAPFKDNDPQCGVTVLDMALIQGHINQTQFLDSPYKIIAADANNSGTVTTADLVVIRAVILQIAESFVNNTSWRFVDASYTFPNVANPWEEAFPERVSVDQEDIESADFVAIKVGDVNLSCSCNPSFSQETPITFAVPDDTYDMGDTVSLPIVIQSSHELAAFQMGMYFDPAYLEFLEMESLDLEGISEESFGLTRTGEGEIRAIWLTDDGSQKLLVSNTGLFQVRFEAKQSISDISSVFMFDNDVLLSVGYDTLGVEYPLELNYDSELSARGSQLTIGELALSSLLVRPNPFNNQFEFYWDENLQGEGTVLMYDQLGRVVHSQQMDFGIRGGAYTIRETNDWANGVYWLVVTTTETRLSKTIIKQ